jgi:hypothetical protein
MECPPDGYVALMTFMYFDFLISNNGFIADGIIKQKNKVVLYVL